MLKHVNDFKVVFGQNNSSVNISVLCDASYFWVKIFSRASASDVENYNVFHIYSWLFRKQWKLDYDGRWSCTIHNLLYRYSYRVRTINRKSNGFESLPLKYRCVCFEHSLFFTVDYDLTLIFSKLLHKFDRQSPVINVLRFQVF